MKITTTPATTNGTSGIRNSIAGGTIPARVAVFRPLRRRRGFSAARRRSRRRGGRASSCRRRRRRRSERGQLVVVGGALLVVDHQEPLRPRADLLGHLADRRADLLLGRRRRRPRRAWPRGRTPRRRCRARRARRRRWDGRGRRRRAAGSGGSARAPPASPRRPSCRSEGGNGGSTRPPPPPASYWSLDAIPPPVASFRRDGPRTKPIDGPVDENVNAFAARYAPSNRKGPSRGPSLSRPVSRILSRAAIHLAACGRRGLAALRPTWSSAGSVIAPAWPCTGWGLPGRHVTVTPVRSYRTFSPLPVRDSAEAAPSAVCFCGTFPRLSPGRFPDHPALRCPDFPRGAGCLPDLPAAAWPAAHRILGPIGHRVVLLHDMRARKSTRV